MQRRRILFMGGLLMFVVGAVTISLTSNSSIHGQAPAKKVLPTGLLGANRLGVQIGLNKPFTVPAAMPGRIVEAFLRIPADAQPTTEVGTISAIKLAPRMVGTKLELTVYALSGDISQVKSCKDWDVLKSTRVASYSLVEGEEQSVAGLHTLGTNFRNGELSFKIVSFPVAPDESDDCGCGRCGDLYCCPNRGYCIGCGTCGDVCCRKSSEEQ
jgi:hypothetical protein